jgi:hypothetical protein
VNKLIKDTISNLKVLNVGEKWIKLTEKEWLDHVASLTSIATLMHTKVKTLIAIGRAKVKQAHSNMTARGKELNPRADLPAAVQIPAPKKKFATYRESATGNPQPLGSTIVGGNKTRKKRRRRRKILTKNNKNKI